eukprot:13366323-Heterocapsa_arctica.AAC.1
MNGKKGQGQLIMLPGGSVQMSDKLKMAQEAWGGPWVVDAEDLPQFEDDEMEPITADEIRRVIGWLMEKPQEWTVGALLN